MSSLINKLISNNLKNGYIELNEINNIGSKNGDEKYVYTALGSIYAVESELLLSAIYRKLGILSPQSYPARYKNCEGIIREDIASNDRYIHNKMNNYGSNCIYFSSLNNAKPLHPFYDKNLMDSYIKMSIADVIFGIQDRFQSHVFVHKEKYGYLDSVAPIHFCYPGYAINNDMFRFDQSYFNGVRLPEETRAQYKKNLEEFDFENFITPQEVYELLRKIDVKSCADEVYNMTGYKLSDKFIDYINNTIEENIHYMSNKNI